MATSLSVQRFVTVGESAGFVDLPVRLSAASAQPVTVSYGTFDTGSASPFGGNPDFRSSTGSLTFLPGETLKTVRIEIVDNTTVEAFESFAFTLGSPVGATLLQASTRVQIEDNDSVAETPAIHVSDAVVDEKSGQAFLEVRLGAATGTRASRTVTVDYSTVDGTASAGTDYVARSGRLSFAPGETTKTVVIDLIDDALPEPGERLTLRLTNPVNASLGDGVGAIEIGPSDAPSVALPRLDLRERPSVVEGGRYADMVISLSAPSAQLVSVSYATSDFDSATDEFAQDYRTAVGSVTFQPGETTQTVRVEVVDNTSIEEVEQFAFALANAGNATLGIAGTTIRIVDDDGANPVFGHGRSDDVYRISNDAATIVEDAGGGTDVVVSSIAYTLPAHVEGLFFSGLAAAGVGNEGRNLFRGTPGNDSFDGRGGIDTVVYAGVSSAYEEALEFFVRTVTSTADGRDTLQSIERLQFSDVVLAGDTTPAGNTYGAYAMLNAAFDTAPSKAALSLWTAQLDQYDGNLRDLAQSMINFYAPGVPNNVLVAHLWRSIVETTITPGDLTSFVGLIDNGSFTQASLLEFVSRHPLNTAELVLIVGAALPLDPAYFVWPS